MRRRPAFACTLDLHPRGGQLAGWDNTIGRLATMVKNRFRLPYAFKLSFQRKRRSLSVCMSPNPMGIGDMRNKAIPALTMIVAAGVIGVAQARLPRPIRVDRDRFNVEMSAITRLHAIGNRR